jgi:hypothetical protein
MVMQFIAGIATALVIALIMGITVGWGLLPMLVALGLGLMAYGLVDIQIKKKGGDNGAG